VCVLGAVRRTKCTVKQQLKFIIYKLLLGDIVKEDEMGQNIYGEKKYICNLVGKPAGK
jgi:hypothetical protein